MFCYAFLLFFYIFCKKQSGSRNAEVVNVDFRIVQLFPEHTLLQAKCTLEFKMHIRPDWLTAKHSKT